MSSKHYTKHERLCFPGLDISSFLHPTDAVALSGVKKLKGFDILINSLNKFSYEKLFRIQSMGDDVRVTKNTCRDIYYLVEYCAQVLDMEIPDVFINQSPFLNAFTTGTDSPMIQLYSGIIDYMEDDELLAVLAHEMGHIKCGHVLYHTAASALQLGTEILGPLKIFADAAFSLTLLEWERKSELSADRVALLVTQDIKPVIRVLMKMAGGSEKVATQIDYDDFILQSREYKKMADKLTGKAYKVYLNVLRSHPFPVMRAAEIDAWSKSDQYHGLLGGGVPIENNDGAINNIPEQVKAESGEPRNIPLAWSAPKMANIIGYRVYRSQNPQEDFKPVFEVRGRQTTRYIDKKLEDGCEYYYCIKSVDQYSNESKRSVIVSATTKYQPPAVKSFTVEGNRIREVALLWSRDDLPEGAKIEIYRTEGPNQKFIKQAVLDASLTGYVDSKLDDGKEYGYYVRVNDEGVQSPPSITVFVSTLPLPESPANFTVVYDSALKRFLFEWEKVPEAMIYRIYQKRKLMDRFIGETKLLCLAEYLKVGQDKEVCFYVRAVDIAGRTSRHSSHAVARISR